MPSCTKKLIGFLALFFFSLPAFSACGHIYLGTSLAASFSKLGNNSPRITYDSGALITDAYPLNRNHASSPVVSMNGGYEFASVNGKPAIALGLGLYNNLTDYGYNGQVIETAAGDAPSTLYHYSYDVNSTRLLAEIQLTWLWEKLSPFVNLGVGAAWNRMSGYTETVATPSGFIALPAFRSKTNINFAYQAGLGVSTAFNFGCSQSPFLQERISLGYRFVNMGKTSFKTRGSSYPYQLNTGLLSTNDVYLSYTHLF